MYEFPRESNVNCVGVGVKLECREIFGERDTHTTKATAAPSSCWFSRSIYSVSLRGLAKFVWFPSHWLNMPRCFSLNVCFSYYSYMKGLFLFQYSINYKQEQGKLDNLCTSNNNLFWWFEWNKNNWILYLHQEWLSPHKLFSTCFGGLTEFTVTCEKKNFSDCVSFVIFQERMQNEKWSLFPGLQLMTTAFGAVPGERTSETVENTSSLAPLMTWWRSGNGKRNQFFSAFLQAEEVNQA